MGIVSLTLHDGRRIGIPSNAAFLVLNLEKFPDPSKPKAKAQILYALETGRMIQVRDSFKQILSSFPLAFGNQGWSHLTDIDGRDLVVAGPSVIAYEQRKTKEFDVTFELPTGPVTLGIRTSLAEIEPLLKPDPPAIEVPPGKQPPSEAGPSPRRKSAAKKPAAKKPSAAGTGSTGEGK